MPYNSFGSKLPRASAAGERAARAALGQLQSRHRAPRKCQGVPVVFRIVVGHPGTPAVYIRAAQGLRVDFLAGCRAHQRRTAQEHASLIAHDDSMIRHGRHVCAARGARSVYHCNLGNSLRGEARLIEEYASEMLAVGEYLVLFGQECAAAFDQVDAGQSVVAGNFLRPQMLFDGQRIISAAFDGRIVRHHHAFAPRDAPDPGDETRARQILAVHALGRERG